jgi:hypothetical protein
LSTQLVQVDNDLVSAMDPISHHWNTSEGTLAESTASKEGIPSSSGTGDIKATSAVDVIASEKGIPSTLEIEDVKEISSGETAVSQTDTPSSATDEEDKRPAPDGGLSAWLQVLGGWLLVMNSR